MRRLLLASLAAAVSIGGLAAPLSAQSYADQRRWDEAQQRYQAETDRYNAERDHYYAARDADRGGQGPYRRAGTPPPPGSFGETDYDASRDYRDDPRYQERTLGAQDQVYRGSDGRYYCKRSDGTTGLIIGGAAGGVLGNVIDGGRHRTTGTLLGGALGALLGRSADQNASVRCR